MAETGDDEVVSAISALMVALKPLDTDSRAHAVEFVAKRLGIALGQPGSSTAPAPALFSSPEPGAVAPVFQHHAAQVTDIRSFAASKKPKTVNEKVAVIAYYLAHLAPEGERRDHVITDDIKTYFIQADFELPTAPPAMTLSHAKNAGYLNGMDRGQYKLNAVGHNLVAHKLPSGDDGVERRPRSRKTAQARPKAKKKKKAK